ncbi:AAA family ATPase [Pseudomonas japonica]|uniref:AAA family ATPase n=1 Tax=Pseudomonas japonica TaxID=256466 RepID=UPI0015E2903D|nr:ATP-binding protein [Pseudomonas japonica]MBA1289534.1 ATP-binding protein [Pseudomonas japonica]
MITAFGAQGFKSLANFTLDDLGRFTCLVGLNGAGKSTILQLLDFCSHIMRGDVEQWLQKRGWSATDLGSKFTHSSNIALGLDVVISSGEKYRWVGAYNRFSHSCTSERVERDSDDSVLFRVHRGRYYIGDSAPERIDFIYNGSILTGLKESLLPPEVLEVKQAMLRIKSLELLSPHLMRSSLRDTADDVGPGGEKLASFLYSLKGEKREKLLELLKGFYPAVVDFKVKQERAGWKKLQVIESYGDILVETEAKHINDGLLRILAIIAQSATEPSLLIFDEVENGVNPEIVERLVELLQNSPHQVIVTTHSPMILNYLDDDVAAESVRFVYRSTGGSTCSRPLFALPRMRAKLGVMGPGEAFVDTSLSALIAECHRLDAEESGLEAGQ